MDYLTRNKDGTSQSKGKTNFEKVDHNNVKENFCHKKEIKEKQGLYSGHGVCRKRKPTPTTMTLSLADG